MIAVVDYSVGNLFSLTSSLKSIGADVCVTGDKEVIMKADKIILPGVGAFSDAAAKLRENGLDKVIIERANEGVPLMGICLGEAFSKALGEKKGITRYGSMMLPMDEALILSAVDISGRGMLCYDLSIPTEKVGDFDTELVKEFFIAFCRIADVTVHIRSLAGENSHHIIEGAFKSVARSLAAACSIDERYKDEIPSTKGVL